MVLAYPPTYIPDTPSLLFFSSEPYTSFQDPEQAPSFLMEEKYILFFQFFLRCLYKPVTVLLIPFHNASNNFHSSRHPHKQRLCISVNRMTSSISNIIYIAFKLILKTRTCCKYIQVSFSPVFFRIKF